MEEPKKFHKECKACALLCLFFSCPYKERRRWNLSVGLARLSRLPAPFPVGSLGAGGTHTKPPPPRRSEDPLRLRAGPGRRRRRVPPRHPGDRSLWMRSPPPLQNTAWGKSIPRPFPGGGRRGRGGGSAAGAGAGRALPAGPGAAASPRAGAGAALAAGALRRGAASHRQW